MNQYFKNDQGAGLWQYYKITADRHPPGCEVVNFLNQPPLIEFREYDLTDPEREEDYRAFWEYGQPITQDEYQVAYQRATVAGFDLLIDGRWSGPSAPASIPNDLHPPSGKQPSFFFRCYRRLISLVKRAARVMGNLTIS